MLQATDDDEPNTPNSSITYSIAWTNGSAVSTYFTIDSGTGAITAQRLNYEVVNLFTLRITARDMGPSPMEGYTYLNVTVQVGARLAAHTFLSSVILQTSVVQ